MATTEHCKKFIETIGPIIQKYAKEYGFNVASPIIGQACNESAYGTTILGNVHNYFGMKAGSSWNGKVCTKNTKEQRPDGTYYTISANFRAYDTMEEGVKGYFDFITSYSRYSQVPKQTTPRSYLEVLRGSGYCTSLKYVDNVMAVVNKWDLTRFDNLDVIVNNKYYDKLELKLVDALKLVGETDTTYKHRKSIAIANGINDYSGTADQNNHLLELLKEGKLRRY